MRAGILVLVAAVGCSPVLVEPPSTIVVDSELRRQVEAREFFVTEGLVEITRMAARETAGTDPERPVTIDFVEVASVKHPGSNGVTVGSTGEIRIRYDGDRVIETIIHEVAHVLTPENPTGDEVYDGHSVLWRDVYRAAKAEYYDMLGNYG